MELSVATEVQGVWRSRVIREVVRIRVCHEVINGVACKYRKVLPGNEAVHDGSKVMIVC
jgi:hypothetical protein